MFRSLLFCLLSIRAWSVYAQTQSEQIQRLPAHEVIDHALQNNVLTFQGSPFHAVLDIKAEGNAPAYSSRIELFWAGDHKYRLLLSSPSFDQTLIINGALVEEHDHGDSYPGWLQQFVTALLNPIPRLSDYGSNAEVTVNPMLVSACVERDDRLNGISDEMTKSRTCFTHEGLRLDFAQDLTYFMMFENFAPFAHKQIARTYTTIADDEVHLRGTLSTLEDLNPVDESMFLIGEPTPPDQRILTAFVSTAKEESLIEQAPQNVQWPPVREGKLDGFMIVDAITDRTGQVREASNHNSDNDELEAFGRKIALQYKFKPLLVGGIAEQMPLVLHFTTRVDNPIPELDDKQTRKLISGCGLPKKISDPASAGQQIEIVFQVLGDGHLDTLSSSDRKIPVLSLFRQFNGCHFGIYKQNGQPTPYHAHLSVTAQ